MRSSKSTVYSAGTSRGDVLAEDTEGHYGVQLGSELVTKFHVEFDYEGHDGLDGWESPANKENFVVRELPNYPPSGYYRRLDSNYIDLMSEEDIREWFNDYSDEVDFYRYYRRVEVIDAGDIG